MIGRTTLDQAQLTRRRFLEFGFYSGSAGVGASLASRSLGATAKVAKQTVSYQQTPKGPARCATCSFFQAPSGCNYVEGTINPSGWCMLYQPKR